MRFEYTVANSFALDILHNFRTVNRTTFVLPFCFNFTLQFLFMEWRTWNRHKSFRAFVSGNIFINPLKKLLQSPLMKYLGSKFPTSFLISSTDGQFHSQSFSPIILLDGHDNHKHKSFTVFAHRWNVKSYAIVIGIFLNSHFNWPYVNIISPWLYFEYQCAWYRRVCHNKAVNLCYLDNCLSNYLVRFKSLLEQSHNILLRFWI